MNLLVLGDAVENIHKNAKKGGNTVHLQYSTEGSMIHTAQAVSNNNFWVRPHGAHHFLFFLILQGTVASQMRELW